MDMLDRIKHPFLVAGLCSVFALAGYLLPGAWKSDWIAYSSWGVCLLVICLAGYLAFMAYRPSLTLAALAGNLHILLLSVAVIALFSLLDHRANKIVLDELVIQASALQLLENNEYRAPPLSLTLTGEFYLHEGKPDKRPPLFPFLLSLVHRFLGYSQSNGYILNALLGLFLFICLGKAGDILYPRFGACFAILCFASLPLISQNITSQHLEVLYVSLIAALLLTSLRIVVLGKGDEISLAYLLACGIAMARYEGLLFFPVPFFLHLFLNLSGRDLKPARLAWIACPLTVAFLAVLVGYVFDNPKFWQLEDLNNEHAFGPHYWIQNTGAFMDFMLNTNRHLPGSLPLAMLGLASVPISLVCFARGFACRAGTASRRGPEAHLPLAAFYLALILFLGLVFSYHWGAVNDHLTARFLLFPLLLLTVSTVYALRKEPMWVLLLAGVFTVFSGWQSLFLDSQKLGFSYYLTLAGTVTAAALCLRKDKGPRFQDALLVFWALYLPTEAFAAIAQRTYESKYYPIQRTSIFLDWIRDLSGTNAVFYAESPFYGILARESSSELGRMEEELDFFMALRARKRLTEIYILQETVIDPDGNHIAPPRWAVPGQVEYEVLEEIRLTGTNGVRKLRLAGLRDSGPPESSESP